VAAAHDGGFAIAGEVEYMPPFGGVPRPDDLYMAKVDSDGDLVWEHIRDFGNSEEAHAIIATADGGYLLA
jgi:hypothetical protein